jgi:hypothetical protein
MLPTKADRGSPDTHSAMRLGLTLCTALTGMLVCLGGWAQVLPWSPVAAALWLTRGVKGHRDNPWQCKQALIEAGVIGTRTSDQYVGDKGQPWD